MKHIKVTALLFVTSFAWADVDPHMFPVTISTYAVASPTPANPEPAQFQPPLVVSPVVSSPSVTVEISTFPPVVAPVQVSAAPLQVSTAPAVTVALLPPQPAPLPSQALAPAAPPNAMAADSAGSSYKPLSLDLREMDIVEVLKMLARQNNINLVIGKNVSGRVTASFKNVDFWQGLQTLLSTRDLAYAKEGDLVEIMTESDYERIYGVPFSKKTQTTRIALSHMTAKTAKDALESVRSKVGTITVDEVTNSLLIEDTPEALVQLKDLAQKLDTPQTYHVFRLNNASAEDILPKITPMVSHDYGNIQIDKRSNTVVVQDNPERIAQIADVINAFDTRNKAVLIEAKIVQITLNDNFQWGINWQGVNWTAIFNQLNGYHVTGQVVENLLLTSAASVTPGAVTAPGLTATVGVMEKPNFQAVINFLDTLGKTNLLSSPRVMALNNQTAKIHVGDKVAKITTTLINAGSTTTSPITTENVEFLDVGVKLSVTPTIGDDNTITMKVIPEVSSVESTITTADGSIIPVITLAEAEASLVVKDGVTVVLGGLMQENRSNTDTEVPFFGRIPLLGYLFRSRSKTVTKTELVIFLTPHIVTGDVVPLEAQEKLNLQPTGEPKPKKGFFKRLFGGK
jgi:MSHA type pilus biogenesis protein MshL